MRAVKTDAICHFPSPSPIPALRRPQARLRRAYAIGLTVWSLWLYVFGGRSGARQIVAASIVDRLVFVPIVLVPLAIKGVFPHLFITFAIFDALLAIGAWVLLDRK